MLPVPRLLQLIPQEIPNLNYPTSTTACSHHLDFFGNKNLPGDPVTLCFPELQQSHSPVQFPSHKDQDSSKGDPRQMWILAHGEEKAKGMGRRQRKERRRKELVNNTSPQKSQVLLFLMLTDPFGSRHKWPQWESQKNKILDVPGTAWAVPPDPTRDRLSAMVGQGLEGNKVPSLQDRLQQSSHSAPQGEPRPPLTHGEEADSSHKTPLILFHEMSL